ncbi:MAG TPA: RodZ domain-containing protein [Capillibacterium sp.]
MKEIGMLLKAAREEKGLSLDEVQMVTKIRYKHLVAIEAGDFDQLPGEVYVKGFLVNFAKAVGLDGEEILKKYYTLKNQTAPSVPEENKNAENTESERVWREPALPEKGAPAAREKSPLVALVITGGLLLAGVLIFWVIRAQAPVNVPVPVTAPASAPEAENGTAPVQNGPVTAGLPEQTDNQTEPGTAASLPPAGEQRELSPATKNLLVVEADEVVWMGIYRRASGAMLFEGTLYPGERREWILTEDVTIRIGNAGGLRVSYRGQELGKFGASGQVVTKVITVE